MTIEHKDLENKYIALSEFGDAMGELDYRLVNNANKEYFHTGVKPEFERQGVGKALVTEALKQDKESNTKIIPSCPFVSSYIMKHPEYKDLIL
jgi:predicted GNAT family acetyltransferase